MSDRYVIVAGQVHDMANAGHVVYSTRGAGRWPRDPQLKCARAVARLDALDLRYDRSEPETPRVWGRLRPWPEHNE